jgi:hypothetical protein
MWDVIAKALLLRTGNTVHIGADELRMAAGTQAEIELADDGDIQFRIERQ